MKKPIYVFGHRNPDTDSICSAISYARLKALLGQSDVEAARLGDINKETRYALEYFGVEAPPLLGSLKPLVEDLNIYSTQSLRKTDILKTAMSVLSRQRGHVAPVVDDDNKIEGMISISDVTPVYLGLTGKSLLKITNTPIGNIMKAIDGEFLTLEKNMEQIAGDIYTESDWDEEISVRPNDILIGSFQRECKDKWKKWKGGAVIWCSFQEIHPRVPQDYPAVIYATHASMFKVAKSMALCIPIETMVLDEDEIEMFQMEDALEDVTDTILASPARIFPVVDRGGVVIGAISKSNLMQVNRRQVILVDHNEKTQTAEGIEEAEILEIIDHHRVANVQTMAPLYFRAEPLGSTCTLVAGMYQEHGLKPSREIAGLLLSGILSDTLLFNSPTCTKKDEDMARWLADLAAVNLNTYGMDLIVAGTSLENETPEKILRRDMKRFHTNRLQMCVSQINTADSSRLSSLNGELLDTMEKMCLDQGLDLMVLMITDIIRQGSYILAAGPEKQVARRAFHMEKEADGVFLPDVYSRKKQIIPVLMNAARI